MTKKVAGSGYGCLIEDWDGMLNEMTSCSAYICNNLLDPYAIAHGSDMTKKIAGSGYGCVIEDWDGMYVGDVICMNDPNPPPPTPQPTAPPTPSYPPQAQDCDSLSHEVDSCSRGQVLVDLETMTNCKETICGLLNPYEFAHGSDMTKKVAGSGYGCLIEDWDGMHVGDVICMKGPNPPTPQPTPPPPPANCWKLVNGTGSCPAGMQPADLATLTRCQDKVCSDMLGSYGEAHGNDTAWKLLGSGFGCEISPWHGEEVSTVICMPGEAPPSPPPSPPTPPSPTLPALCDGVRVRSRFCPTGEEPVSREVVSQCSQMICDSMGFHNTTRGLENNFKLMGNAFGCRLEPWVNASIDLITCSPSQGL
eukprot:TRINITY_DN3777_c0_g1_i10.p1 TRINITY_DN3777_c0_g1~~TRINITY_DN3777_c0_g1_i10.p1  ORF type:complete len:364 (+),score=76.90 TRINITY_DN3777_c0_g1_i10:218-1309(+)